MKKLLLVLAMFCSVSFAQVSVNLTVQETLFPAVQNPKDAVSFAPVFGATGITRSNEPVTVGVPLLDSWAVNASSPQVGLSGGPTIGQFECEAHWPSGNCKWLLVNTQVSSLTAGGTSSFTLGTGTGNFGGSNLATDNGSTITVSTSAATFTVKKANFNLFDIVVVGSTTVVATGTSDGLVLVGPAFSATTCLSPPTDCTTAYKSSNDASSTVVIERNGPATAILKADGALKDGSGNVYMRFTARLSFYAGKSYVGVRTILRNADESTGGGNFASAAKGFDSWEARVKLTAQTSPAATFSTSSTPFTYTFAGSENAYLYQAYTQTGQNDGTTTNWATPFIVRTGAAGTGPGGDFTYGQNGYQVIHATTVDNSGDLTTHPDGWADCSDTNGKGVVIGTFYNPFYWPKTEQCMGGGSDVRIGIFPDQQLFSPSPTNAIPYYQAWPQYKIDDLYFEFHATAPASPGNDFLKWQRYLVAKAPMAHYNASNVLAGVTLEDPTEEANYLQYIANRANPTGFPGFANTVLTDWMPDQKYVYGWGGGSVGNQADFRWMYLLQWFTRGFTGRYLWASMFNRFIMEAAYARADFTVGWRGHTPQSDLDTWGFPESVGSANLSKVTRAIGTTWVEQLHNHTYGMIDWYLVSGDKTYLDFINQALPDRFFNFNKCFNLSLASGGCVAFQREWGVDTITAARLEEFFNSIGDSTNAGNAATLGNNLFTLISPDLQVSGTGTSATTDSASVPGVTYPTYGTSRTRGDFFLDSFGTWDTVNSPHVIPQDCASFGNVSLFGPPYPHDPTDQPYQASIALQGIYELARERGKAWANYDLARDLGYGIALNGVSIHQGSEDNGNWTQSGVRYATPINHVCPATGPSSDSTICECIAGTAFIATIWYHFFYIHDYAGDISKEGIFERTMQKNMAGFGTGNAFYEDSSYGLVNAMYYFRHAAASNTSPSGVVTGLPLKTVTLSGIVNNGGGSWTVNWTAPPGVQSYKLKHAVGKQIVDWLSFDIRSGICNVTSMPMSDPCGTWGIDPTTHATWFGSAYTGTQPATNATSITVTGLASTNENFMLKAQVSSTPIWTLICDTNNSCAPGANWANGRGYNWRLPYDTINHEFLTFQAPSTSASIYSSAIWGYSPVTHTMVKRADNGNTVPNANDCGAINSGAQAYNPLSGHPLGEMAFDSNRGLWFAQGGLCSGFNNGWTSIYNASTQGMNAKLAQWEFSPTGAGSYTASGHAWGDGMEYVSGYGKTIACCTAAGDSTFHLSEFDGLSTWTDRTASVTGTKPPTPLIAAGLVSDGTFLYVYGGCNGGDPTNCASGLNTDLYQYNPTTLVFTKLSPVGGVKPPSTNAAFPFIAFDSTRNRIVLYAGTGDLWQYDIPSNIWSQFSASGSAFTVPAVGVTATANKAGYDPVTDTMVFMWTIAQDHSQPIYELAFGGGGGGSVQPPTNVTATVH